MVAARNTKKQYSVNDPRSRQYLCGAGVAVVGQLYGCALEALAPEFFA